MLESSTSWSIMTPICIVAPSDSDDLVQSTKMIAIKPYEQVSFAWEKVEREVNCLRDSQQESEFAMQNSVSSSSCKKAAGPKSRPPTA